MVRTLDVSEVTFDEFNSLCRIAGVEEEKHQYSSIRGLQQPKRFFRMGEKVVFPTLWDAIKEMDDGLQLLECVWVPGSISIGEATKQTLREGNGYLGDLCRREDELAKVIIQRVKDISPEKLRRQGFGYYTDWFEFLKNGGGWTATRVHVHRPNFGFYCFNGVNGNLESPSISIVYSN